MQTGLKYLYNEYITVAKSMKATYLTFVFVESGTLRDITSDKSSLSMVEMSSLSCKRKAGSLVAKKGKDIFKRNTFPHDESSRKDSVRIDRNLFLPNLMNTYWVVV